MSDYCSPRHISPQNTTIVKRALNGEINADLAREYGISRQRVNELMTNYKRNKSVLGELIVLIDYLPTQLLYALVKHNIVTISQLKQTTDEQLTQIRNIGPVNIKSIREALRLTL